MSIGEEQLWESKVYGGARLTVRGPRVASWTTKAYWMARFLRLGPGDRVLDVGCGTGDFSLLAASRAREVVGLDASPTAVAAARHAADCLELPHVSFQVGNAYQLPRDAAPFDKIVCFDLLEHLTEPERALAEMHAVLRPGGRALVYTNCFGRFSAPYLAERRRTGGRVGRLWASDARDHHFHRFTPAQLASLTRGWTCRVVYKNHFLVPLASYLSGALDRAWRRRAGASSGTARAAAPKVIVQASMRWPRLLVQAAKVAVSVFEMETLGRLTPGAGVYLMLEKNGAKSVRR